MRISRLWAALTGMVLACGVLVVGGGASSPAGAASSDGTLVVGVECSCSGAFASSIAIQSKILDGWMEYENANGGVHGHKVKLIISDDGLNPGTSLAQVTKMVDQDHVQVIIDGSDEDTAWGTFVQQKNIPVIAEDLASSLAYSNPLFFPPGQTINTLPASIAAAAKKAKVSNLGTVYCSEDPICAQLAPPIQKAASSQGIKSTFATPISASAPNYVAQCLGAKQAGANGLFVGQASVVVTSFASNCHQQGYDPTYIAESSAISNGFLSSSALTGMVGIQNNLPAFVQSNAAIRTMTTALKHYVPGTLSSPNYSPAATTSWASGMLIAATGPSLGSGPVTSAEILKGIYALHAETLGGLSPPLTFEKGKATTIDCWFYMSVKNQKFTTPYGTAAACGS